MGGKVSERCLVRKRESADLRWMDASRSVWDRSKVWEGLICVCVYMSEMKTCLRTSSGKKGRDI